MCGWGVWWCIYGGVYMVELKQYGQSVATLAKIQIDRWARAVEFLGVDSVADLEYALEALNWIHYRHSGGQLAIDGYLGAATDVKCIVPVKVVEYK